MTHKSGVSIIRFWRVRFGGGGFGGFWAFRFSKRENQNLNFKKRVKTKTPR